MSLFERVIALIADFLCVYFTPKPVLQTWAGFSFLARNPLGLSAVMGAARSFLSGIISCLNFKRNYHGSRTH